MNDAVVNEASQAVRDIMFRMEVTGYVFAGMCIFLAAGMVWMLWMDHRERKARKAAEQARMEEERRRMNNFGCARYQPTETGDIQIVNGVEFRRMGTPRRM